MAAVLTNFVAILICLCITMDQCNGYSVGNRSPIMITHTFINNDKAIAEYRCLAYLNQWDLLSWYQRKESKEILLLAEIQQKSQGYIALELQKNLELSDNGSTLLCVRNWMLPNNTFETDLEMPSVPLMFQTLNTVLETPYVTVEPGSEVKIVDTEVLQFVCGGSPPVDGRELRWFLQGRDMQILYFDFFYQTGKYTKLNNFSLPMEQSYHGGQLYCAQSYIFELHYPGTNDTTINIYGELARSLPITLLYRRQRYPEAELLVTPGHFVDTLKPYVEFTCYAFSRSGDVLSWYQSKGSNGSDGILLRMIQVSSKYKEEQWIEYSLNKTLEQADNGSEIYCVKQSVQSDNGIGSETYCVKQSVQSDNGIGSETYCVKQSAQSDGSSSDRSESKRVLLSFQRHIEPLEPTFVNVEPSMSVHFEDSTLPFKCTGSKPIDGRTYTWFRMDSNSNLSIPEDQKYDASTNLNVLHLSPKETYHQNQLFCVQGFLSYIRHTDGTLRSKFYGELARSGMISLTMGEKGQKGANVEKGLESSGLSTGLVYGLVGVAVLVAALVAVVVVWRRRRGAARDGGHEEDQYATAAELTHAELDLTDSCASAKKHDNTSPYAEIIGVYNPRK